MIEMIALDYLDVFYKHLDLFFGLHRYLKELQYVHHQTQKAQWKYYIFQGS